MDIQDERLITPPKSITVFSLWTPAKDVITHEGGYCEKRHDERMTIDSVIAGKLASVGTFYPLSMPKQGATLPGGAINSSVK
ncbi:MAG: hypothetical protein IPP74_15800 [Alphaproteobacteria bacterium]|nr:hypothetical protein [Alphaproteobacteria bacterium]